MSGRTVDEILRDFTPHADDLVACLAVAGYVIVPREPTKEMEKAGDELDDWGVPSDPGIGHASALAHWAAMIDAALKEPADTP